MAKLPPHYLDLVADASLKSFWRRRALHTFLRRAGIRESFLSTWAPEETKRDFLYRLFLEVESHPQGELVINRMADSLVDQSGFPDLEGWEDSVQKKEAARQAVGALKQYLQKQQQVRAELREREVNRKRAAEIRDEIARKKMDLSKLEQRLSLLSAHIGKQSAGYDFQDWFYDLVDYFEVIHRRPYVTEGRQIDGSVTVDGTTYLVELKFTAGQADAPEIDSFYKKVSGKADNTMGIMVSISGYSSVAIKEASFPKTPLLLLDHSHVYALLSGTITFSELVGRVRRHSSQTANAHLPVKDFQVCELRVQLLEFLPQRIEGNLNRGICDQKLIHRLPAALATVKRFVAHGVNDPDVTNAHGTVIVQPLLIARDPIFRGDHFDYDDGRSSQHGLKGSVERKDSDIGNAHPRWRHPQPDLRAGL